MDEARGAVKTFIAEPVIQQRLAKYLVLECFRTSELEDLHAGTVPDSKTGDYTDVVVKAPYGEIPWRDLSRFDDAEMKKLLIDVVNRTYSFIHRLFDSRRLCISLATAFWVMLNLQFGSRTSLEVFLRGSAPRAHKGATDSGNLRSNPDEHHSMTLEFGDLTNICTLHEF